MLLPALAEQSEVSVPTIERRMRRRETGRRAANFVPRPVAVKTARLLEALPELLAVRADATLAEHSSWWREVWGMQVSTATMSRALARRGPTRKKRR